VFAATVQLQGGARRAEQRFCSWRKIAKRRQSFLETEYSVANSLFLRKKIAKKQQKTSFLAMVSPPLCLLAIVSGNKFAT
jgi:hypothetical protein